jgi:hypothetical protein
LAGKYGEVGQISAYNCTLTLTAYDALTHTKIASLQARSFFDDTVRVLPGVGITWKRLPYPSDAEDKDGFVKSLAAYGETWTPPDERGTDAR